MPFYLTRFSYTPATWAKLIANPEDRRAAATQYVEAVGGKLHGFWYALGEYDAYALYEAPDTVSIAAMALAINSGRSPELLPDDSLADGGGDARRPAQSRRDHLSATGNRGIAAGCLRG